MEKVFEVLKTVFNYDYLYIGGGNSKQLTIKLDKNMKIVTNADGIKGGSRLWVKPETAEQSPAVVA
jgi:polyphosphate glucokinase